MCVEITIKSIIKSIPPNVGKSTSLVRWLLFFSQEILGTVRRMIIENMAKIRSKIASPTVIIRKKTK